ncbi:cache domain-containing protein [Thiothrix nivea]|uniref:Putative cache sensor protein n=1 Tax=Thiothrix nivea (strain ATCC 35100 / DSM 5205 / JP2) TaxID=870187 RepID=A0A656HAF8_THINJ|nr:cache domain-containing protein [Thiothrix nivea]EIJ33991.1 putative cache sensor protein [Thiothrix nivea DSM 5205]
MNKLTSIFGATLIAFSLNVFADDAPAMGTEAEAQAMSESAAELVNKDGEAAFDTFGKEGDFQQKDLYVFCMDMEGKMLSHPKKPELVGQNLRDFDKYGDKLFDNMIKLAETDGKGWVAYNWPYPGTEDLKEKKSYIIKNDKGFFCGVGAYAADSAAAPADGAAPAAPPAAGQ